MAKANNHKMALLYMMRELLLKTDEEHVLNASDLIKALENINLEADRRTIYSNVEILQDFVPKDRILLGTTNQGSYRESANVIVHSGLGETTIGSLTGNETHCEAVQSLLSSSGFPCTISQNIRFTVWNKLMINASSSVLSGVLGVRQGFVASDPPSWEICKDLIREICRTAALEECIFDEEEQIERIRRHLENAPDGYTSLYADLKNGRKTEVDFISGHIVQTAEKHGLSVPVQKCIVRMVHAIENRKNQPA